MGSGRTDESRTSPLLGPAPKSHPQSRGLVSRLSGPAQPINRRRSRVSSVRASPPRVRIPISAGHFLSWRVNSPNTPTPVDSTDNKAAPCSRCRARHGARVSPAAHQRAIRRSFCFFSTALVSLFGFLESARGCSGASPRVTGGQDGAAAVALNLRRLPSLQGRQLAVLHPTQYFPGTCAGSSSSQHLFCVGVLLMW